MNEFAHVCLNSIYTQKKPEVALKLVHVARFISKLFKTNREHFENCGDPTWPEKIKNFYKILILAIRHCPLPIEAETFQVLQYLSVKTSRTGFIFFLIFVWLSFYEIFIFYKIVSYWSKNLLILTQVQLETLFGLMFWRE